MKSFSEHLMADMFDTSALTDVFDTDHRVKSYGSLDEIQGAGFPADGYIYRAAGKQFSQSPHIGKVYVGYKTPSDTSWADALGSIKEQNNEWYALSCSARRFEAQKEVAEWAQANEKLCILASGESNVVNADTGDIADWCKTSGLDRVAVFYHPASQLADPLIDALPADDPIPEATYFGKMLSKHPGSATWALKGLAAVPVYDLSGSQLDKARKKNATTYTSTAGLSITSDGRVASGEYIDVIHGIDWLKALIQNRVFTPMVQRDKIPFTDQGVQIIVSQLRSALADGVKYELLASYDISFPKVSEIAANYKGERMLPDVKFTAILAGAINRTIIDGVVTL
jgi:hypothetical protein